MSTPVVTDRELAAYLDGRLSGAERDDVLGRLAASDEARALLAASARVLDDLGDGSPSRQTRGIATPLHRARRKLPGWRVTLPALAAASIAVVILMRTIPNGVGTSLDPSVALGAQRGNGSMIAIFGFDWDHATWSEMRGNDVVGNDTSHAVRLGVRTAQLLRALAMHDGPAARLSAGRVRQFALEVSGGAPVAAMLADDSFGITTSTPEGREALLERLRSLTTAEIWFDSGLWTQSIRHAHNAGALATPEARAAARQRLQTLLGALGEATPASPRAAAVTDRLRRLQNALAAGTSAADAARLDSAIVEAAR
ncbi:MAG: hypothetical protein ACT4P7_09395 [Gemmatimonadaceae bacterium]